MLSNRIALIALTVLIAFSAVQAPVEAHIDSRGAVAPEDDFVIESFPHWGDQVEFRDTWGARRPGGRRHQGTDILSPRGTAIRAIAAGTVIFADKQRLSGYTIKIEHADGWKSTYMHLNNDTPGTDDGRGGEDAAFAPGLAAGDTVEAGQLIGWVGDSGNAEHTITHTHLELIHNDTKLNPYPYLATAWRLMPRRDEPSAE